MNLTVTPGGGLVELEARLQRQEDLEAIRNVLAAYCRGVDRMDEATLRSIYHEDAIEDRGEGLFIGRAQDWIPWTLSLLPALVETQHCIFNSIIDLDGDQAHAETYFRAYHRFSAAQAPAAAAATGQPLDALELPSGEVELLLAGRYLDRLTKRNGQWRFSYRKMVNDWTHTRPIADGWFADNPTVYRGARSLDDTHLGSARHPERAF